METEVRELKIPVPWGHIAARDWGDENGEPVVAIHGWLDNAGTFDTLMPLIDRELHYRFIAIDLPGNGFSSHFPPGFIYNFMDIVTCIMRVIKHFGWKKVSFMGHSLGAALTAVFSSIYPDIVDKVILIDYAKPVAVPVDYNPGQSAKCIDKLLQYEEKLLNGKEPVYTKEEALQRLLTSSPGRLTEEAGKVILKRGIKPSSDEDGFVFTRDIRYKIPSMMYLSEEQLLAYLKRVNCRMLLIMAEDHPGWESKEKIEAVIEMYRSNCKYFEYVEVSGGHHVHLNTPHAINKSINNFLATKF